MMQITQIVDLNSKIEILKRESQRVLNHLKNLDEGHDINNYWIIPDMCTVFQYEDNFYVRCSEYSNDSNGYINCIFNAELLSYDDEKLKEYVDEENQKYYKNLEEEYRRRFNKAIIDVDTLYKILNAPDKSGEEKYTELCELVNNIR